MKEECIEEISHAVICLKECGRVLYVGNSKKITVQKIHYDGCVIKNEVAADYVVRVPKKVDIVVELKGRNVEHGLKQIFETFRRMIEEHKNCEKNRHGIVVCRQYPSGSTTINKMREKIRKKFGAHVDIFSGTRSIQIEQFI